jgi:hypothetical protein
VPSATEILEGDLPMRFNVPVVLCALLVLVLASPSTADAAPITRAFDFEVDSWYAVDQKEGPITIHRVRLETRSGGRVKSTVSRPLNETNMQPIALRIEYSNEADRKWTSHVEVRWLDEDGKLIDGFQTKQGLTRNSARKVNQATVTTLKYGLERAATLEVEVRLEP